MKITGSLFASLLFPFTFSGFNKILPVSGHCDCKKVCAEYVRHGGDCWKVTSDACDEYTEYWLTACDTFQSFCTCPPGVDYGACVCSKTTDTGAICCDFTFCPGTCGCNIFGCDCEACNGCNYLNRKLPSMEEEEEDECADYSMYMSLTSESKIAHFQEKYCDDHEEVNPELFILAETLADANKDGTLICDEFKNAYNLDLPPNFQICLDPSARSKSAKKIAKNA